MATTEFAPPAELDPPHGGIVLTEEVRPEHKVAWLIQMAIDGTVDIGGNGAARRDAAGSGDTWTPRNGDDLRLVRTGHGTPDVAAILDTAFAGRDEVELGSYDSNFARAWQHLQGQLLAWRDTSGMWDPAGGTRKVTARVLGIIGVVVGALGAAGGGALANQRGPAWLVLAAAGGAVAGAGLAAALRAWELRVRTPAGSAAWLRVESFRRFLAGSEAYHAEEAAKRGVLREYTAWAVAVGEIDRWQRAVSAARRARDRRAVVRLRGPAAAGVDHVGGHRSVVERRRGFGGGGFGGGSGRRGRRRGRRRQLVAPTGPERPSKADGFRHISNAGTGRCPTVANPGTARRSPPGEGGSGARWRVGRPPGDRSVRPPRPPAHSDHSALLVRCDRLEDVELGGPACGADRRDHPDDGAERHHHAELPRRDRKCPEALRHADRLHHRPAQEGPQAEPADGAEQGHHQRLAAHHPAQLPPALSHGPEQPQLAGPLVDRQRQRVGDAHEGDHDGHDQQHIDDGQDLVDLAGNRVDVLLAVLHVGRPEPVGDRLDGGLPVGGRHAVDQVDEQHDVARPGGGVPVRRPPWAGPGRPPARRCRRSPRP